MTYRETVLAVWVAVAGAVMLCGFRADLADYCSSSVQPTRRTMPPKVSMEPRVMYMEAVWVFVAIVGVGFLFYRTAGRDLS